MTTDPPVGWLAPEIDVFGVMSTSNANGVVSQSGPWMQFNSGYEWFNMMGVLFVPDPTILVQN